MTRPMNDIPCVYLLYQGDSPSDSCKTLSAIYERTEKAAAARDTLKKSYGISYFVEEVEVIK